MWKRCRYSKEWKSFLPHRSIIREYGESTKLRIVSETSAKASKNTVFLNECLETGSPLQNSLYDIIVRSQMRPIKLCGDIQKAFWQIQIREPGRNSLRFHWIKNLDPNILEIHRFTKLVFRLTQTPFISQGTLKQHFQNYMKKYPKIVKKNSKWYVR